MRRSVLMMWKSGVQLQLLKRTLSCDPTSLVQPCFNHISLLAAAGPVASCLLLSLQKGTQNLSWAGAPEKKHLPFAYFFSPFLPVSPFVLPIPLPGRPLLSETHIYLAWMELGKTGGWETCWIRGLNCYKKQWRGSVIFRNVETGKVSIGG